MDREWAATYNELQLHEQQDQRLFHETFSPTSVLKMFELDFNETDFDKVPSV